MASSAIISMHDIGITFLVAVTNSSGVVNLNTVQSLELFFKRPDNSIFSRICTASNPTGGIVKYVSTYKDFDQPGLWSLQLVVRFADHKVRRSTIPTITVSKNLG